MQAKFYYPRLSVVALGFLIFVVLLVLGLTLVKSTALGFMPPLEASLRGESTSQIISGTYQGLIAITVPVQLGVVDLGLTLEQEDDTLTGHINVTDTLVYSSTPAVSGSLITGVLTPTFLLSSEAFTITVAGRQVQRSFQLAGDVLENGVTLQGAYTETLTGLTPDPIVVVGEFLINRPVALGYSITSGNTIYLPLIRR